MNDKFIPGKPYFMFSCYDQNHAFPKIETLVYLGEEIELDGKLFNGDFFYFQDAYSFVNYGRFDSANGNIFEDENFEIKSISRKDIKLVVDFETLIEELVKLNIYLKTKAG